MSDTQTPATKEDIEHVLFGSPLGAFEMLAGLFLIVTGLVSAIAARARPGGRHRG